MEYRPTAAPITGETAHLCTDDAAIRAMDEFDAVAIKAEDASSVYRILRPIWAPYTTANLVEPAEKLLALVPSSRAAVLDYMGMLTHEATHLFFSKQENPHIGTDFASVERAVSKLAATFDELLSCGNQKSLALQVLKHLCSLFADICQWNCERPVAKKTGVLPADLLHLFKLSNSVLSTLKLFDKAVSVLLANAKQECFNVLLDASKQGFYFDWVWLHTACSFSTPVMIFLLKMGADEFKEYVTTIAAHHQQGNKTAMCEVHQLYKQKFMPVIETFTFLASKHNTELSYVTRQMLMEGIEMLQKNDSITVTANSDLTIPFLLKLLASSPDVLKFVEQPAIEVVTPLIAMRICIQISQINSECILPADASNAPPTYTALLVHFARFLNPASITILLDTLLEFAFEQQIFEKFRPLNPALCALLKEGALELMDEIITVISSSVHSQPLLVIDDKHVLGRLASNSKALQHCIYAVMHGGEKAKFYIRLLNAFCLATCSARTSEVIIRFILDAKSKEELSSLDSLLLTLVPFMPKAPEEAIEDLPRLRNSIEYEKKLAVQSHATDGMAVDIVESDGVPNIVWIRNLVSLNEWQTTSPKDSLLQNIRFEMTKHYGHLMTYVLSWVRDELDRIHMDSSIKSASERDEFSAELIYVLIEFTKSLGQPKLLEPGLAYKICAQFASILVNILKFAGEDEWPNTFPLYVMACRSVVHFLQSQTVYVRYQFVSHFLDEALSRAKEMFGDSISINVWQVSERSASGAGVSQSSGNSNDLLVQLNVVDAEGESPLDQVRKLVMKERNPLELANCGIIGKGARNKQKQKLQKPQCLRQMLYVETMIGFCGVTDDKNKYSPIVSVYKQLATVLTDRFCDGGESGTLLWGDWEQEKAVAHRYKIIADRLSDRSVGWSLLSAVADVHPCLWFCLPLLKAILASVMIQCEHTADQRSPLPPHLLDMLDRWFCITKDGKVLPMEFVVFFDVIRKVNARGTFLILSDLWRYFQSIVNAKLIMSITEKVERATDPAVPFKMKRVKGEIKRYKEMCVLVIQHNMGAVSHLFPFLRKEYASDDDDE